MKSSKPEKESSRKVKTIVLSLGTGIAKVLGLISMIILARVLTKQDLAAYRQTLLAYMVVAPFLGLGIGQGIYYFLPVEKLRIRGRVFDSIAILSVTGLLFAIFIAFGGNQLLASQFSNPQVAQLLLWMIPYTIISTPAGLVGSVLVARNKVVQASVFQVTRQVFIGMATIIPVLIWQDAKAPLIGNVVASVLFGIEAILLMLRSTPKEPARPSLSGMKEMIKYSAPLGIAGMLGTISLQIDKVIVGVMCSPEEFATFTLGAVEIPFLAVITGSMAAVLLADMRKAVAGGNKPEALRLFRVTAEKTSILIFPITFFLFVCASPFIRTLFSDNYADSVHPFRMYLFKLPYRIVVFGSILMALGQSAFILKRSLLSLAFGAVIKVVLVYIIGPLGAILGALIVAYTYVVPSSLLRIARESEVTWRQTIPFLALGKHLLMSFPVAALSALPIYYLRDQLPIIQLVVAGAVVAPYCLWWWNGEIYSYSAVKNAVRKRLGKSL